MSVEQIENHNDLISTLRWQVTTLLEKFVETSDFFYYARANVFKRRLHRLVNS